MSFLLILLAVTCFAGFLSLSIGCITAVFIGIERRSPLLVSTSMITLILAITTFIWLGTGPLN